MIDPITTNDLYGSSDTTKVKEPPLSIPIEETPEIVQEEKNDPVRKRSGCLGIMVKIIFFAGLVAGGIWLSGAVRQLFPSVSPSNSTVKSKDPVISNPATTTSESATLATSWKTYDALSGVTYQLPLDVLSPICDGTNCTSRGTYLPGGTRFTVAPRGAGYMLADFRGTAIADGAGVTFVTKQITTAGHPATEFTGTFTGRTVSGYAFNSMRGVMIELTPTTSLEMNHFTPSGIVADYASDDKLFDEILKTVTVQATR